MFMTLKGRKKQRSREICQLYPIDNSEHIKKKIYSFSAIFEPPGTRDTF